MTIVFRLCSSSLFLLATIVTLPAQNGGGLNPGTCVATTFGWYGTRFASGDSVQMIDTFANRATPLVIKGFPVATGEYPWAIEVEHRRSFFLGSAVLSRFTFLTGNVFHVAWTNSGWSATRLNTNAINEAVTAVVVVGDTIYFMTTRHFSSGGAPSSKVWSLPRRGGRASVLVDLTARNASGTSGSLVALGTTLHAFTFVSDRTTKPGEHWAIDTTRSPAVAKRIGLLPRTSRTGAYAGWHFGVQQAQWDPRAGAFVLAGLLGDVLWRDPVGNDLHQYAIPTPGTLSLSDQFGSLAIDTDSGALILGDKDRHIEQLNCPHGSFQVNKQTLALATNSQVIGLDYVPGAARYVSDGPAACKDANGKYPCSFVNSRPSLGNNAFAFILETTATRSLLMIGSNNVLGPGGVLLPFSLAPLGAPGCSLGTSAEIMLAAAGPNPTIPVRLPNIPATAWVQWLVYSPANPLGVAFSEARRVEVR